MKIPKDISVVGIGKMGSAIGARLSRRGYNIIGYNRTRRSSFSKLPFSVSQSIEVVRDSHVVILSLFDEDSIRSVLLNADGSLNEMQAGTIVIDTTTHNPEFAAYIFNRLAEKNIIYLDAPVSGGVEKAANGDLAIMVGGEKEQYDNIRELLLNIGKHVYYLGDVGAGQAAKLVNQSLVGILQLAVAEAMTLGKKMDLDGSNLQEVIKYSAGDSQMFRRSAPQMMMRSYSHEFQTRLIAKDLNEVMKIADTMNIDMPLVNYSRYALERHCDSIFGDVDAASIFEKYQKK